MCKEYTRSHVFFFGGGGGGGGGISSKGVSRLKLVNGIMNRQVYPDNIINERKFQCKFINVPKQKGSLSTNSAPCYNSADNLHPSFSNYTNFKCT